ncbi:Aste57867_25054 [Aphanomyces stellatus]|uniref:Aste57867_25054 protein n=1 Tax=Aphanomyces stellatus TaxID=120398 RepID=A0A485LT03_9STRA|nr:hypothetical protein As57867_024976 [Aphanomyces stellatus]VFU01685.1 Aste57867_25054 [Aphanomyces stellatus]
MGPPLQLVVAFGGIWTLLTCAWALHCIVSRQYLTPLHAAMTLVAVLANVDMASHVAAKTTPLVASCMAGVHALFLSSMLVVIMLVANGYAITVASLRKRDWARIILYASVSGFLRWWRCVADAFPWMLLEMTVQLMVLLYVMRATTMNMHFALFLMALLRREGVLHDVPLVYPHYNLFRNCRVVLSVFFTSYILVCAWTFTVLEHVPHVFFVAEQVIFLALAIYFGTVLRPVPKYGFIDVTQQMQLNFPQFFRVYSRLLQNMDVADLLSEDEVRPIVGDRAPPPHAVVVIENPPSRTDQGNLVPNIGVGIKRKSDASSDIQSM